MTVEGMIKIVYELLKDKLNIVKLTFSSGVNLASEEYEPHLEVDRCPLCGIALNEDAFAQNADIRNHNYIIDKKHSICCGFFI